MAKPETLTCRSPSEPGAYSGPGATSRCCVQPPGSSGATPRSPAGEKGSWWHYWQATGGLGHPGEFTEYPPQHRRRGQPGSCCSDLCGLGQYPPAFLASPPPTLLSTPPSSSASRCHTTAAVTLVGPVEAWPDPPAALLLQSRAHRPWDRASWSLSILWLKSCRLSTASVQAGGCGGPGGPPGGQGSADSSPPGEGLGG